DYEAYAKIYFLEEAAIEKLQPILDNCVNRFQQLSDDDRELFRGATNDFVRLYRFLSQIMTFKDVELEKNYVLLNHLLKKLPYESGTLPREVLNEIVLDS